MTKPFSEPSQGRENAYLGWTANQLLRRPPAAAAFANLPWALVDSNGPTVPTGYANQVFVDFTPTDFLFTTNDDTTFANVPVPTRYGIAALRGGMYLCWAYAGLSTSHSITHGTKRGWLAAIAPFDCSLAAFDIGVTVGLNVNNGSTGIDSSVQSWNLFDMILVNIADDANFPDDTGFGLSIAQESGFDADSLVALLVIRIADAFPGFVIG